VANVSARAVRTDTGEIIASTEFTGPAGKGFEQTTAGRGALSAAGRQLAADLFAKIGKVWSREQSGMKRVNLVVKGVDDYARLTGFKAILVNSVKGVKDVQQRSLDDGRAELEVTLAGSADGLASDLSSRKYPGYTLKVKKVTPNAVEVELK